MKGKLIAIEGLDGSGKGTQTQLLEKTWAASGRKVRRVSFPNYGSDAAKLLDDYLHGKFGTDPNAVNPYAASTFFAIDRYASYHQDWKAFYEDGGIIIADRYTTSNAIHQCAKLPQSEWDGFLNWLFEYEYKLLGLPAPDAVIYLQVAPAISQKLMSERYQGDESKKDIHEQDIQYLIQCRGAAEYCAEHLGWHKIVCVRDGVMRTVNEIQADILLYAEEQAGF